VPQIVIAEARREALGLAAGFPHGTLGRPGELALAGSVEDGHGYLELSRQLGL
jgi:hypothetical protein